MLTRKQKLQFALTVVSYLAGMFAMNVWTVGLLLFVVARWILGITLELRSTEDPLVQNSLLAQPTTGSFLALWLAPYAWVWDLHQWTYNQRYAAERAKNKLLRGANATPYPNHT